MAKIKANSDVINAQKLKDKKTEKEKTAVASDQASFDSIQQLKPENLLVVTSKENILTDIISKTNSSIGWPKLQNASKISSTKRFSLPPGNTQHFTLFFIFLTFKKHHRDIKIEFIF